MSETLINVSLINLCILSKPWFSCCKMGHVAHRITSNADVMTVMKEVTLEMLLFFNDNTSIPLYKSLYLCNDHKREEKVAIQKG